MRKKLIWIAEFFLLMPFLLTGTVLGANKNVARKEGRMESVPVEAAKHIYKGAFVVANAAGYAEPATDAADKSFLGTAYEECDNSAVGAVQGGKSVRILRDGVYKVKATSITQAMVGSIMYIADDETVDDTSVNGVPAGILVDYESETLGWIDIREAVAALTVANNAITTVKILDANVTEAKLLAASLTGLIAKVVADVNVIGGLLVLHRIDVADVAGDTDVVLTHKTRIIDAWGLNTGVAAHATDDTWQVKNGADAISDVVAKTATVNGVVRVSTIDPAKAEIDASGTLRITAAKDTNAAVTVYVLGIRV